MIPKVGETWRHFKGGLYHVRGFARHTEFTSSVLVIYSDVGEPESWWARPIDNWTDWIDRTLEDSTHYSGPRFVLAPLETKDPR